MCTHFKIVYFFFKKGLRDQLTRQEVAALTVVDTYVRERLCFIRQHEEDIDLIVNQVRFVISFLFLIIKFL